LTDAIRTGGNKLKGDITFVINDSEAFTLNFAINAICDLEEEFDIKAQDVGTLLGVDSKVTTIRKLFQIGLREHHPAITEREAGRVMGELDGGVEQVSDLLLKALTAAFPDSKGQGAARPPKAKAPAK
jgi:hypothetical protein